MKQLYGIALCALLTFTACRKKEQKPEYKVNVQVKEVSDQDVPVQKASQTRQLPLAHKEVEQEHATPEVAMPGEDEEVAGIDDDLKDDEDLAPLSLDEQAPEDSEDAEAFDIDSASIVV